MRRRFILFLFLAGSSSLFAQDFGLSFSYFVPRNCSFSIPVSLFSIRGLGVDFGKVISLETGASLYRMSGLNIIGLPFENAEPMAGPNLTLLIPGEIVFRLRGKKAEFNVNGGGFVYNAFFQKLNEGNIDRAIRAYEGWQLANADLSYSSKPGAGWKAGAEFVFDVTRQWGLSFEVNYLAGSSALPLKGTYAGLDADNQLVERSADFKKAKLDLTGLEFSLSVLMRGRR